MKFKVGMSAFLADGSYARIVEVDRDDDERKEYKYVKFDRFVGNQTRWGFYNERGESNNPKAPNIEDAYFEFRKGMTLKLKDGRSTRVVYARETDKDLIYELELVRPIVLNGEKRIYLSATDDRVVYVRYFLPKVLFKGAKIVFEDDSEAEVLEDTELSNETFTLVPTNVGLFEIDSFGRVKDSLNFVFEIK
jgi:hypothetical protein